MPAKKAEPEAPAPAAQPAAKKPKKGDGKAKGGPPEKKSAPAVPENPNFRHIVRLANTDLDGKRPVLLALTEVRGMGMRMAESVAKVSGMDPAGRLGDLNEQQTDDLEKFVLNLVDRVPPWMLNRPRDRTTGEKHHYVSVDLETAVRDDVNQMKMIRCYRGIRHEKGQKVRGQRTRSNGRTGMAAGVMKKKLIAAAQAAKSEKGAAKKA